MIRSHKNISRRNALLLNLAATALIFAAGALAKSSTALAQTRPALPVPQGTPAALIKKIVFKGEVKTETDVNQATVTRGGTTVRIVLPFILYSKDVIETFEDTQVTVLFFNSPAPTHDNEIIIDTKSKVVFLRRIAGGAERGRKLRMLSRPRRVMCGWPPGARNMSSRYADQENSPCYARAMSAPLWLCWRARS